MTETNNSSNVLVMVAGLAFVAVVASVTVVAVNVEDASRAATIIASLGGLLTTALGFLALFLRLEGVKQDMGEVKEHTTAMTNGLGDAKIRAGLADVLRPDLIDPAMLAQLQADRRRQAAALETGEVILGRAIDPEPIPTHRRNEP